MSRIGVGGWLSRDQFSLPDVRMSHTGGGGGLADSRAQEGGAMTNKWSIHTAQSSWTDGQRDSIEVIGRRRPYPTPDRCEMKCWSNGHAAISRVFCSSRLQHLALLGCSSLPTARGRSFLMMIILPPTGLVCSLQRSKDQGPRGAVRSTWADGSWKHACRYSTGDANGSLRSRQDLLFTILVLILSNNPLALIVGQ